MGTAFLQDQLCNRFILLCNNAASSTAAELESEITGCNLTLKLGMHYSEGRASIKDASYVQCRNLGGGE